MTGMSAMAAAALLGAGFGFQGSVSPGPLQTIIISETMTHGVRSSWRAAIIPPCTDPFALAAALFIVSNVPNLLLACIAFVGAGLLVRFSILQFRTVPDDFVHASRPRLPFATIWATNFLNPNLWIFSFTINAFQINEYYQTGGLRLAATYILSFFLSISFFNLLTAVIVARLRAIFNPVWLARINRALGVFLIFVALRFVWLGVLKLGWVTPEILRLMWEVVDQVTRPVLNLMRAWVNFAAFADSVGNALNFKLF